MPVYQAHHTRHADCGTGRGGISISAATLDTAAWEKVEEYLAEPDKLDVLLASFVEERNPYDAPLTDIERALADVAKQQSITADAVATLGDPEAAAPLLAKLRSLAEHKRALAREQSNLATKQLEWREALDRRAGLIALWRNAAALDTADYNGRREALAVLGVRALVYGRGKYRIVTPREPGTRIVIGSS